MLTFGHVCQSCLPSSLLSFLSLNIILKSSWIQNPQMTTLLSNHHPEVYMLYSYVVVVLLIFFLHMYLFSIWFIALYSVFPSIGLKLYLLSLLGVTLTFLICLVDIPNDLCLIRISTLLLSRTTNTSYLKSHVIGCQQFCSAYLNIPN